MKQISVVALVVFLAIGVDLSSAESTLVEVSPGYDYDYLVKNYIALIETNDCKAVRSHAAKIYRTAITQVMQAQTKNCPDVDRNSTLMDEVKRVFCVFEKELTEREQVLLIVMTTLYAIASILVSVILMMLESIVRASIFPSKKRGTVKLQIVSSASRKSTVNDKKIQARPAYQYV